MTYKNYYHSLAHWVITQELLQGYFNSNQFTTIYLFQKKKSPSRAFNTFKEIDQIENEVTIFFHVFFP